ncbi:AaceriADR050Wp [[Ashbya] aceris (nom. inval.)]|nr:AaceriADR050Wp [[Ashbya] aceris (nom. inval.)]
MQVEKYFSFQIFFIFLRESLEIVIIISILLTIVKQALLKPEPASGKYLSSARLDAEDEVELNAALQDAGPLEAVENSQLYRRLKIHILSGGALGLLCCMLVGGLFIVLFYYVGKDLWSASEHYYEGVLSIVASLIISFMGLFFLRMGRLRDKFRIKLASMLYAQNSDPLAPSRRARKFSEKYALFILPFVTSLREGLEAVVFIGGIGIDQPLTSIPLSMISASVISYCVGRFFFASSGSVSLEICLVTATCLLYLVAGGLFSKGVWQFELQHYVDLCNGQDMSEVGSGPGSYDISNSVWHVNCCNGERDGLWMIFTAIFGWTNSATYGSVISYIVYWLVVVGALNVLMIEETLGYIPYIPIKWQARRIKKRLALIEKARALQSRPPSGTPPAYQTARISQESTNSNTLLLSSQE